MVIRGALVVPLFAAPLFVGCFPDPPASGNVLSNPDFEAPGEGVPEGWTMAGGVEGKGRLEIVSSPVAQGGRALCLHPNESNTQDILSFNVGQGMSIGPLQGRTLAMEGRLLGRDGATAVLAAYAIDLRGGIVAQRRLTSTGGDYETVRGTFDVPEEGGRLLIVNAHAEGTEGTACFDDLRVVAPEGASPTGGGGGGGGPPPARDPGDPLVRNPGFEAVTSDGRPEGWTLEDRVADKGAMDLVGQPSRSGRALRLRPNASNTTGLLAFNVGQGIPAGPLRGQSLQLSGWLGATGGATAMITAYVIDEGGEVVTSRRLSSAEMPPAGQEATLQVPDDDEAVLVIVAAAVEGTSGEAYFDDVTLEPQAEGATLERASDLTARVTVDAGEDLRVIPRTLYGQNLEWPYGGNLIWDFRREGINEPMVELIDELGVEVLRWPGGLFADYYDWRLGVGPRGERGESEIMPGGERSAHTFGTDEALDLADRVGAELLITVNAHDGTPADAVAWMEYVNRRQRVRFWEVGNEFYIRTEGPSNVAIPPAEYAERLNAFGRALKDADPDVLVMGIGAENFGRYTSSAFPDWNPVVLERASGVMDYLAVHNAYFPVLFGDEGAGFREVYEALLASPELVRENLRTLDRQIREHAPARADDIEIAVTEWGPLFHLDVGSRWIGHVKTLGSALFVASTLKVFVEDPRTTVATAFKLNDVAYQGWIAPRRSTVLSDAPRSDDFIATAPYYALQMFTRHFGEVLVESATESPTFDAGPVGMIGRVTDAPYLDVVAARSRDGDTLYVMGINKHFDQDIRATVEVGGFGAADEAVVWTLNGTGIDAHTGSELPEQVPWGEQIQNPANPRFGQGGPDEVWLRRSTFRPGGSTFEFTFPAHSVTSIALPAGGGGDER